MNDQATRNIQCALVRAWRQLGFIGISSVDEDDAVVAHFPVAGKSYSVRKTGGQSQTNAMWPLRPNSLSLLLSKRPEVTETHQLMAPLIPETERERFKAGEQRDWFHGLKQRLRLVAPFQIVIG